MNPTPPCLSPWKRLSPQDVAGLPLLHGFLEYVQDSISLLVTGLLPAGG